MRVSGGITEKRPLDPGELYRRRPRRGHGLVLVGSHVAITSRQLDRALDLEGVRGVELSMPRLLEEGERERELEQVASG